MIPPVSVLPPPLAGCEIRPSPIHGQGGFATRALSAGARVIEYQGELISKTESLRRCEQGNPFIFYFDEEHDLDGTAKENAARFLNHSCAPNCEAQKIGNRIWIVAARDIARGEELTFDYGYDLEDYRDYPCRCGSPNCRGYIVEADLAGSKQRDRVLTHERVGRG